MIDIRAQVVGEVEDFLSKTRMAPSTLGRLAVHESKIIPRLRSGGNITLGTIERLLAFIADQRAQTGV
ncbi:MAG: hypothetical protein ACRYGG_10660 [Janthinobacterium lividum]